MPDAKPPVMQRSRGQLATVYAPHSLFTFEGGAGACMARPYPNPPYESASGTTRQMIHEQIVEFMESWLRRATAAQNAVVPIAPERALDQRALREGAVYLPSGSLHFQVPERVAYVPFPTAFVCTRCDLYRQCGDEGSIARDAFSFCNACPFGRDNCADDWQQLDVVLAHWSGDVETLSPMRRYVNQSDLSIQKVRSCATCGGEKFYLRRNGATFSRWRFECADCRTLREIRLEDRITLELLKEELVRGSNVVPQINMEPISYRASAVYYPQGDRLLVFGNNRFIALLQGTNQGALGTFLATTYGFPAPAMDDATREQLLRDAGRGNEWDAYVAVRDLLQSLQGAPPSQKAALQQVLTNHENTWRETVFAGQNTGSAALADVIAARQHFVRRFDPVRMAVEHKTLAEERLHAGATLPDGKLVSVDVRRPDDFMVPDEARDGIRRQTMIDQVVLRLGYLGISELRLIRGLQVCEYTFGFTRTSATPLVRREKAGDTEMPVRLNLFDRVKIADSLLHPVLCLEQSNEGLYVRLIDDVVAEWLNRNQMAQPASSAQPLIGGRLLEAYATSPFSRFLDEFRRERGIPRSSYPYVYTLLHTIAHHVISVCAAMSGLDAGSFGEHIFVPDLAILVYRRGMTMDLGNLSSMWRDRGDPNIGNEVLDRLLSPESLRCGSESVCTHHGGACPDCLLIPETACLTRNELLSRSVLSGKGVPRWDADATALIGFYEVAAEHARM